MPISGSTTERPSVISTMVRDARDLDLSGIAQQIAYSILFSIAPLLIALAGLSGLVARAVNAEENPAKPVLDWMTRTMPSEASQFLKTPVENALNQGGGAMLSIGGLLALWGARGALGAIMKGLNTAYGIEEDSRGFAKRTAIAIGLTVLLAVLMGAAAFIFALGTSVGDTLAGGLGLGDAWSSVSEWLRWPLLAVVVILAVACIHKFGPDLHRPLTWCLPGAAFTVVGWVIASALLGLYFRFNGGYEKAYGAFGSVLAFLFYLWVLSVIVLLGGIVNRAVHQDDLPATSRFAEPTPSESERADVDDRSGRLRARSSLL